MVSWKAKIIVATLAVATLGPAVPQDADACLFGWCRRRAAARVAYYGGYAPQCCGRTTAGFAPNPCCGTTCNSCPAPCTTTQRVCNYVPQTCYRTVYRQVPVTVYRPTTTCDPCTGCPRTVMQPCTTVQHVAQRVPVTTYRQVCRVVQRPVVPLVQQYVPVQQYAAPVQHVAPAAPACCGGAPAAAVQSYAPAPAVQPYAPAPAQPYAAAPATQLSPVAPRPTPAGPTTGLAPNASGAGQEYTQPSLNPGTYPVPSNPQNGGTARGTSNRTSVPFQPRPQNPDIRPLPDLDRAPQVNPNDRTASRVAAGTIMPISWQTSAAPEKKVYSAPATYKPAQHSPAANARPQNRRLDGGGWMPAY